MEETLEIINERRVKVGTGVVRVDRIRKGKVQRKKLKSTRKGYKMARSGNFLLQRDHNVKLLNTAADATGDVLITSSNGNYSFIITLQKESGFDSDSWY